MSIPQAITAVAIVIALFKMIDYLTARSKRIKRLVIAQPVQLVKDGKYIARGLTQARISENELRSLMRLNGIKNLEDVEESYLEMNG